MFYKGQIQSSGRSLFLLYNTTVPIIMIMIIIIILIYVQGELAKLAARDLPKGIGTC
jgi:hypothetical protein